MARDKDYVCQIAKQNLIFLNLLYYSFFNIFKMKLSFLKTSAKQEDSNVQQTIRAQLVAQHTRYGD